MKYNLKMKTKKIGRVVKSTRKTKGQTIKPEEEKHR